MEKAMEDKIQSMIEERGFNVKGIPSVHCAIMQYIDNDGFLIEDAEDIADSEKRREYLLYIWKEFVKHENDFWLRCFSKYHNIENTDELGTMGFWVDNPEEDKAFENTTIGMKLMMKIEGFPSLIMRLVQYNSKQIQDRGEEEEEKWKNVYKQNSREWVLFEIGKMLKKDYRIIETEPEDFVKVLLEGREIDLVKQQGNKKYIKLLYYYVLGKGKTIPKKFMTEEELKKVVYPGIFKERKTDYAYILDNIETCHYSKSDLLIAFEEKLKALLMSFFDTHE